MGIWRFTDMRRILGLADVAPITATTPLPKRGKTRPAMDHVIILDGTLSSLTSGQETNAGHTFRLLREAGSASRLSLFYEAGIQWKGWSSLPDIITGASINDQIQRAYGFLASRYRPGDRVFLFGYSRGGFAVRSLAGMIDRLGPLRAEEATERNIRQVFRHYRLAPNSDSASAFRAAHCHTQVEIAMIGVWDTVKALGLRLPLLWRLTEAEHAFHQLDLGPSVRYAAQALALDETRVAFSPLPWQVLPDWNGLAEDTWFRGAHPDIGGQVHTGRQGRQLANIPLVWMLERVEAQGVPLPQDWRLRFPCDASARAVGTFDGWGKVFLIRSPRANGPVKGRLHPTVRFHTPTRQIRRIDTPKQTEASVRLAALFSPFRREG